MDVKSVDDAISHLYSRFVSQLVHKAMKQTWRQFVAEQKPKS